VTSDRGVVRRMADWVDIQWSLLERSLRAVAPRARGRLLDVGCGDKPYEAWFRDHVDSYIGIEHAATFAATAAGHRSRADVVYGGGRLPFRDGAFDTVLSVQVLEHTPRPAPLVAEMGRVLAPDGLLILTAPFQFRLHGQPHDYFRYSPHGLRQLCEDTGLEIIETVQQGSLWSVVGHKLSTYLAFRVARVGGLVQQMGKLGHEAPTRQAPRWWTLPAVAPAIVGLSGLSRVMDRFFFEPDEALGFLVLARRRR
jgi:SAM-dependent methyltransferase